MNEKTNYGFLIQRACFNSTISIVRKIRKAYEDGYDLGTLLPGLEAGLVGELEKLEQAHAEDE